MTTKRTAHRSSKGTKLYAKRSTARATRGEFRDIQTHKRASAADQRKRSKAEGTWWRWGVALMAGYYPGDVYIRDSRADAIAYRKEYPDRKVRVVRIKIDVGLPDPLRKRPKG